MKLDKGLKIALIILLIILISIISFGGIYVQEKKSMKNIVADYKLGMDLQGSRVITMEVDQSNKIIYYDKEGNVVDTEDEEGYEEEVPVNEQESLTKENYLKTKEIIEKRLKALSKEVKDKHNGYISEYVIRLDEETGKLMIKIPENDITNLNLQYIVTVGKLEVQDEDKNVLLDNSNIKSVQSSYSQTSNGIAVYLDIQFNKESVEKLKEITNNHLTTTDEEGNDTSKYITIKIDDDEIETKSFDKEITNGLLQVQIGSTTTSSTTANYYLEQASDLAILLNNGNLPITYTNTTGQNRYVVSDITTKDLVIVVLAVSIVVLIACIVLSIIYKKNGLLAAIAHIGYIAVLLIIIRYTNVILTIEGIFGILISIVLNYIFSVYLLKEMKKTDINIKNAYNKTVLAMLLILIPAMIVGISMCFANWMPLYSFGATIFFGMLTIFIYNTVITRTLLVCSAKNQ